MLLVFYEANILQRDVFAGEKKGLNHRTNSSCNPAKNQGAVQFELRSN